MGRSRFQLIIAMLAVLLAAPQGVSAQVDTDPEAQAAALAELGVDPETAAAGDANPSWDGLGMFSEDMTRLLAALSNPVEGLETYAFGDDKTNPPVIQPGGATSITTGQAILTVPDDWVAPESGMGDSMAFAQAAGGAIAPGDEVVFFWTQFDAPYDFSQRQLTINEGFPLTIDGPPVWQSTFAGDTWEGANLIPNAVWDGNTLSFDVKSFAPPQSFPLVDLPGFYYRSGDVMAMALHADSLRTYIESVSVQAAATDADTGEGQNQTLLYTGGSTVTDAQLGDPLENLLRIALYIHIATQLFGPGFIEFAVAIGELPIVLVLVSTFVFLLEVATPPPPEEPAPDPEPEPTTTEPEPEPETTAPPVVDDADDPPADEGGGGGAPLILIAIAVFAALVLLGLFTQQRKKATYVGGTRVRKKKEDLHSTPRDVVPPKRTEQREECDWALIFHGDTQTTYLKKPEPGKVECCTYHVKIESAVWLHDQAASFRQDIRPERQYIPDIDFGWDGISYHQNASTRSGPAGRQDWQHGDGNPIDQSALDDDLGFWQQGQGEEPPEIATHIMHQEATRVRLWLDAGCPGVKHRFDGRGDGELTRLLTGECTNDAPEESCPVELTAMDLHDSVVFGDIQFRFGTKSGSDIDELERYTEELVALDGDADVEIVTPFDPSTINPGKWDGHTHDTPLQMPTLAPGDFHGSEHVVRDGKRFSVQFNTFSLCDTAQLVPEAVYDTTERVSSHAGAHFEYMLEVEATTEETGCDGTCKGHPGHKCHEAPSFTLRIDNERKQVKVDGLFHYIHRPDMGDRHNPPVPGATRRWELT